MRVIAGTLGGRRLVAPRGQGTRPTSDRVREALFSALGPIVGLNVLDLYAGSGALAIEALSRGASRACCVEQAPTALRALRRNLGDLGLERLCRVVRAPVARALTAVSAGGPYQLVFADPPYQRVERGQLAAELDPLTRASGVLAEDVQLILEHGARDTPPELARLRLQRTRRYGDTALSFYHGVAGGSDDVE